MKQTIKQFVTRGRHSQDQDRPSDPQDLSHSSPASSDTPQSLLKEHTEHQPSTTMALAGKVALITGASKGIGKATAVRLARDGARVVINYSADKQAADEVVKLIGTNKAAAIQADASKVSDIDALVQQTVKVFGKIDILIPCAGMLPMSPLEATTEELFDKIFALNVKGPYFLAQVLLPILSRCSSLLTVSPESYPAYARRLPHRPDFHNPDRGFHRHASLPPIPGHEGCHRADGPRVVERSRPERHLRQRRLPWPHRHRAFPQESKRADNQDALEHEPLWSDWRTGGDCRQHCVLGQQ